MFYSFKCTGKESKLMHTQCACPYASAIASESGWTSFLVLTFFISIIYGCLLHFYVHMERSYTWEGIGMLIKMRTIGLDIQSALLKRVVICNKS